MNDKELYQFTSSIVDYVHRQGLEHEAETMRELMTRFGKRVVEIHVKDDGLLMIGLDRSCRFMTFKETVLWRMFRIAPNGVTVIGFDEGESDVGN